jgi:hypothetical protein
LARDALLDKPAAKIGVDKAALGAFDIPSRRANRASHFVLKIRTRRSTL